MKYALIIGNGKYDDQEIPPLKTPAADSNALAKALLDKNIGSFDEVISLINPTQTEVFIAIGNFLTKKKPDDLVLVYFSGHGLLDDSGHLFLAVKNTQKSLLRHTAIPSSFITEEMDICRSKSRILILDCCYSGAFERGAKGEQKAITKATFEGNGSGRFVLTASNSTERALEGDRVLSQTDFSLYTHFLLDGLTTGQADVNNDGNISIDEWHNYAYEQVVANNPNQTPKYWSYGQQGILVIAKNPISKPAQSTNSLDQNQRTVEKSRSNAPQLEFTPNVGDIKPELIHTHIDKRVYDIAFSPNSKLLALTIMNASPNVGIFQIEDTKLLPVQEESLVKDFYVAFSPNGNLLVSSGQGGTRLWSVKSGSLLHKIDIYMSRVALSSNGNLLAIHDHVKPYVMLFRVEDGVLVRHFDSSVHKSSMRKLVDKAGFGSDSYHSNFGDISFSPDDSLLASIYESKVNLWSMKDGVFLRRFEIGNHYAGSLAFSPDGDSLAVEGNHSEEGWSKVVRFGEVCLLSVNNGNLVHRIKCSEMETSYVAFSPDGNLLASGGDDGVRLWSVKNGDLVRKLDGHPGTVKCVAFSPDGKLLAAGGEDGLRFWKLR